MRAGWGRVSGQPEQVGERGKALRVTSNHPRVIVRAWRAYIRAPFELHVGQRTVRQNPTRWLQRVSR
jgi:hypothetical protein